MTSPIFTKRHYELLARVIKDEKWSTPLAGFMESLILRLREDNPRFDEVRFREACGIMFPKDYYENLRLMEDE